MSEALRQFLRDSMSGKVCMDCGDPIEPGEPCQTCIEKAEIVRLILGRGSE